MCHSPFSRRIPDGYRVSVPCGKCTKCVGRKISGWSHRLIQEDKVSFNSSFITLTYGKGVDKNGQHYPRKSQNGFSNLDKRDLQLFFKRLRKESNRRYTSLLGKRAARALPGIKYYAVGEYGSENRRPHYHIILYNTHIDAIPKAWTYGHIHYGKVSGASVGYTLKYISKEKTVGKFQRDDRLPEFSLKSKGLGKSYVTPSMKAWHKTDLINRLYCTVEGNKKISMPRYYKNLIYDIPERTIIKNYYAEMHTELDKDKHVSVNPHTGKLEPIYMTPNEIARHQDAQQKMFINALKNDNLYEIIS